MSTVATVVSARTASKRLPGKALLKGTKILSPFSDTHETVLRVVRDCVPSAEELGRRTLTPHELRDCLDSGQ